MISYILLGFAGVCLFTWYIRYMLDVVLASYFKHKLSFHIAHLNVIAARTDEVMKGVSNG